MRIIGGYIKERIWFLILAAVCVGMFASVLFLYNLPVEAAGYGGLLCAIALLLSTGADFYVYRRKILYLESLQGQAALLLDKLPEPRGPKEEAYHALLLELDQDRRAAVSHSDAWQRETVDYYTMWAHQIKTPISAMRLILQEDASERGRELEAELFRVERYVELVLSYLRLGGGNTDYLIREYPLENILRQAARKYAPLFIRGKVSLDLQPTSLRVLTDEKWLQLVVEQTLSNAVKYAPGGRVTVRTEGWNLLIEDNGVGIAPEDLPRIFDRGFTGCNGRIDKRATGIGLYLCRQICRRLGHTVNAASEPGRGTVITIGLARPYLEVE